MPKLPCQTTGLCRVQELLQFAKKKTIRYGIFAVLLLEVFSLFIYSSVNEVDYANFWYPNLANITISLLIYKNICDRSVLKYCQRTIIALKCLLIYFIIGALTSFFPFLNWFYDYFINYLLLGCVGILLLLSFKRK